MLTRLGAIGLAIVLAQPAAAFERMLRSDCQASLERLGEMLISVSAPREQERLGVMANSVRVTPQGWCELRRGAPGLENADFETLAWRAEEITRWTRDGIPPLALEFHVTGLRSDEMQDANLPSLELSAVLRQIPEAGQVVLERAVLQNNAGDVLALSSVYERVFLSSKSMMQVSMGSMVFKAGLASMTLEGTHENPFGLFGNVDINGTPQGQRDAAFETISTLPEGFIDDASRAELMAYAGDLPRPVGTIELSVASEQGFGMLQGGMAVYTSFAQIAYGDAPDLGLDVFLSGLTLRADWTPAVPVAD